MEIEVRLLGSMEVINGAGRLDLRGDRQKALVAFLALDPGRVRRSEAIIDALWDGADLPPDPRQSLHTWASRCRSVLGEDRIVARDGGYLLAVDPGEVDLHRFEGLVDQAAEVGCGYERRLALLDQALALWHGRALEGFDSVGWAIPVAQRLEELRASAEDGRGEALIELDRAELAVPQLEAAAVRSPLRERTHHLLMNALYRSGRQAEALRVYQRYRARLATDLGLEPGDELIRLERQIAQRVVAAPAPERSGTARGYTLHERIGEGAFAVVYRADSALGRSRRRGEGDPLRVRQPARVHPHGSRLKPSSSPGSSTRTSCRSTTTGASPARPTW